MENREYVIITDSTADMDAHYYSVNNVEVLGLHYTVDGQQYTQCDKNEMDTKTFFDKIRKGSMPHTSPLTYEAVTNILEKHVKDGKDIFFLSFSGSLSSSYQTTQIAAEDIMAKYPDCTIKVVDSVSATSGQGLLLHMCIKKRNTGMSLIELANYAERVKRNIVHLVMVQDLKHLHRGGRLSKMSAVMGGLLNVKPLLSVDDSGSLFTYGKAKGKTKAIEMLAEDMKAKYIPNENEEIFIAHGDCEKDAEALGNYILKLIPEVRRIRYVKVGPVIGTHAGADGLVLAFVGKSRTPTA